MQNYDLKLLQNNNIQSMNNTIENYSSFNCIENKLNYFSSLKYNVGVTELQAVENFPLISNIPRKNFE